MTRVKVCGITNSGDARLAVELGAWSVGLIFVGESPRSCSLEAAGEIGAELRRSVNLTGVFVNAPLDEVAGVAEAAGLSILQLHGDEGPRYCAEAARRTGCRVMKAVRVRDAAAVRALRSFRVDLHLLDAHDPRARGGTGETFDWELARAHNRRIPLVLSGGLTPDNVGEGVTVVRPWAVDSASGTEERPGRKDPARLRAFFGAVAAADGRSGDSGGPPGDLDAEDLAADGLEAASEVERGRATGPAVAGDDGAPGRSPAAA